MNEQTRELQLIELDILEQVLKICEKYSLTYYMLGGTLLGAIRHKGFIPWDDDIDLGLPRPDYEKFIAYAEKELVSPYQLHTTLKKKGKYSYYYARVENTDVVLKRTISIKEVLIPAFIDIFPLDGVPNDVKKREKWISKCSRLSTLFSASQIMYRGNNSQTSKKRKPVKEFLRNVFIKLRMDKLLNTELIWKLLDKALKENDYDSSDVIINFCGAWGLKEMFPKSVYGEGELYQFEQYQLRGPKDYDAVLSQMYGDYMTPPEKADQEHHYLEVVSIKEN